MEPQKKKLPMIPILLVALLLLCGMIGWMIYTVWCDSQQVFHDVTVELGTESISIRDFLTPLGHASRASFVTDPSTIDLNKVGRTSLTLKHGTQTCVVNLIVEDTTPPAAVFLEEYTVSLPDSMPQAGALVLKTMDYSQVRVYYAESPVVPDDYSDTIVTVIVEDTSGNSVEGQCTLHFTGWLKESCTAELGQTLTPQALLLNPEKDANLLNEEELKQITASLGEHTLTVHSGNSSAQCTVTVQDTTAPTLKLWPVRRFPGESAELEDFVVSAEDLSGEPEVTLVGQFPDFNEEGTYTITIEAKDSSGNVTQEKTTLWVSENLEPPEIFGASEEMTVEKNSSPDFLDGVTAEDDIDETCDVRVDTSGLDLSKEGTYTITYYAIDSSGNVGTCDRTVIVE